MNWILLVVESENDWLTIAGQCCADNYYRHPILAGASGVTADDSLPKVSLNADNLGPRSIEDRYQLR